MAADKLKFEGGLRRMDAGRRGHNNAGAIREDDLQLHAKGIARHSELMRVARRGENVL